jgi:cytochrome c peroxidase
MSTSVHKKRVLQFLGSNKIILFLVLFITLFGVWGFENEGKKYTKEKLGALLFEEKILSKDSTVSCSSCHKPAYAFADTSAFSVGIGGKLTSRNTPSVLNMKNRPYYFLDGRSASLTSQSLMPIQNANEMNLSITEAVERLNASDFYAHYFKKVFNRPVDSISLALAFEAYELTLETTDSKFDDWSYNKAKLSDSEERGRQIFLSEKSRCFDCHFREDFTNDDFKNIGLFNGLNLNDSGRFTITKNPEDLGKFKTPGLRNIALTAPYMHNGMFKTLEEVVDYYNNPSAVVPNRINIDSSLMKPLNLSTLEKTDLIAFLKTLTDKKYLPK